MVSRWYAQTLQASFEQPIVHHDRHYRQLQGWPSECVLHPPRARVCRWEPTQRHPRSPFRWQGSLSDTCGEICGRSEAAPCGASRGTVRLTFHASGGWLHARVGSGARARAGSGARWRWLRVGVRASSGAGSGPAYGGHDARARASQRPGPGVRSLQGGAGRAFAHGRVGAAALHQCYQSQTR